MDFDEAYQQGSELWTGEEDIDNAVGEAIDRWEARTGWKPDFSVVQGYCIAINRQYVELLAENNRLRESIIVGLPGFDSLHPSFCNKPVSIGYTDDMKTAAVWLCGLSDGHEGECNPDSSVEDHLYGL